MGITTRMALVGVVVSLMVLVTKVGAWWATQSTALLADAAESSMDVLTAGLLFLAVRFAAQPADEGHPWGHGKAEYLSSGFQGGLISVTGVGVIAQAVRSLYAGSQPLELGLGLGLSTVATVLNLALAIALLRVGHQTRSAALIADGRHNLADVWTTVGGWIGLGLAWLTHAWWMDGVVALGIALLILSTGVRVLWEAVNGLMDASIPEAERAALERRLAAGLPEGCWLERLRARESSQQTFVECVLRVPGSLTVGESHALCDALEAAATSWRPSAQTVVHVEPAD